MGDDYSASGTRNIFVSSVDRDLSDTPVVHTITSYAEGDTSPGTPQFVKISDDSFLLLWMKDGVLNYCKIDGSGNQVGEIYTMKDGKLSDCVPIVTGGKLLWYTWENEATDFYEIDLADLSKTNTYEGLNGHVVVTTEETTDTDTEVGKKLEIKCTVCGEVLSLQDWLIDSAGKLTVSGIGDFARTDSMPEWYAYRERIKTAEIKGTGMTNLSFLLYGCSNLTSVDLSALDTSQVTKMHYMFSGCKSLAALDVSGFDTGKVTSMLEMFDGCSSLTSLDVSGFDTSSVTSMAMMFYGCSGLTTLNVSKIDTSSVTDMGRMFYGCSRLTALDVSGFDTGNVTDMMLMFYQCRNLTALDLSAFNTSSVVDMRYMFSLCNSLTTLNLSGIDMSSVTYMDWMLPTGSSLTTIYAPKNVSCDVDLPSTGENESWQLSDGTVVTALPKNLSSSVLIEKKTTPTEDTGTTAPDTGSTGTDTGTTTPDTGSTDAGITAPDTGSADAGTTAPDTGTMDTTTPGTGTNTTTQTGSTGSTTNAATRLTAKNTTIKLAKDTYTYDGKAKKPAVTVYDSKGKKISSQYYTVTYQNNTKVGKATVTIKFKGKYTGTIKKTYKINPKATTLKKVTSSKKKSVTVTWKKQAAQTTGYEIQYATNSKFTRNKKTVTVKGAKVTSRTITKLSGKTRYYVRIRTYRTVDGKKYYSAWSKALSVTVR
jgi:surface protein